MNHQEQLHTVVSQTKHFKRYFLVFWRIKLRTLLRIIESDTRSTTGKNLREIMMLSGKSSILDIQLDDVSTFPYFPMAEEEAWRSELLLMMMTEREEKALDETDTILFNFLCTD